EKKSLSTHYLDTLNSKKRKRQMITYLEMHDFIKNKVFAKSADKVRKYTQARKYLEIGFWSLLANEYVKKGIKIPKECVNVSQEITTWVIEKYNEDLFSIDKETFIEQIKVLILNCVYNNINEKIPKKIPKINKGILLEIEKELRQIKNTALAEQQQAQT